MYESTAKQVVSLFTAETVAEIQIKNTSREGGDFREAIFARLASEKKLVVKLAENAFTDPEHIAMWRPNTADWAFIARRFFRRFAAIFPRFFIKGTAALPMRRNFHPIFPPTAAPTRSPFGTSCTV